MNIFNDSVEPKKEASISASILVDIDKPNWTKCLVSAEDVALLAYGLCTARTTLYFLDLQTPQLKLYCDELAKFTFTASQDHEGEVRDFFLQVSVDLQMGRKANADMQADRALQVVALATLQCAFAHIYCLTRCGEMNGLVEIIRNLQEAIRKYVINLSWQTFLERFDIVQERQSIDIHAQVVISNLEEAILRIANTPNSAPIKAEGDMKTFFTYSLDHYVDRLGGYVHEADRKTNPFLWMDERLEIASSADISLLDDEVWEV